MRKILFRGKRVDDGEWIEGNLLSSDVYPDRLWITDSKTFFDKQLQNVGIVEVDPDTVGQDTCFHDFYGGKIYEHDIIKVTAVDNDTGKVNNYRGIVKWFVGEGAWIVVFNVDGEAKIDELYRSNMCRVLVGNIFDNPEMIAGVE